jgi:hypothetical protein
MFEPLMKTGRSLNEVSDEGKTELVHRFGGCHSCCDAASYLAPWRGSCCLCIWFRVMSSSHVASVHLRCLYCTLYGTLYGYLRVSL